MLELLTVEEMAEADRRTIEDGTPGYTLMKNAGRIVFEVIRQRWSSRQVLVVCGPGNNGGDGYVIARELVQAGWPVQLASTVPIEKLSGDALFAAKDWQKPVLSVEELDWQKPDLIVDALFGAGLSRPVTDETADLVTRMNDSEASVVAVDVPSGIDGNTGKILGAGVEAAHTVTFFRAKPGHYLHPGKRQCGEVHVCDIGIDRGVLQKIKPKTFVNGQKLWYDSFPSLEPLAHKYSRGSALVCSGGPHESGAARLGAMAALRCGAGIVTMLAPGNAMLVNACHLTEVMLKQADTPEAITGFASDPRTKAVLIGPGAGPNNATAEKVKGLLQSAAPVILDADGLTCFENDTSTLFGALRHNDILTPHEGEFRRLFGSILETQGRLSAAKAAAAKAGSVVILKGDDTVIAAPDRRAVINQNGSPWLATAGSGDVLAGILTGLVAQGMPSFEAACAGVWLHARCGALSGPGAIAGDLVEKLPDVLREMHSIW